MMIKKMAIASLISLFVWQSVADAASISTRVRILESKVAKHDKQIKSSARSQQESEARVAKSLSKVKAIERKLNKMMQEQEEKKNAKPLTDKRYAFP